MFVHSKPNYPGRSSHVSWPKHLSPNERLSTPFALVELRKLRNSFNTLDLYSSANSLQNAGFLIPITSRGLKIGMTLGKSYLIYGPKLGYRGSVFNLVYKSTSYPLLLAQSSN